MKLFWRFFLPITVILALTVILIGGFFTRNENQIIINQSHERLESNIATVESSLDGFISTYFSLAETLAKDNQVEAFMTTYDLTDSRSLDYIYNKLDETLRASRYLNNVLLVPSTGILQLDARKAIWESPHDHREEPYFLLFADNPNLIQHILPPKLAPVNQTPIFDLAYRVVSDGEALGFIILPINVNLLMDEIIYANLHDRGIVVLIADNEGQIYGSRNKDHIFNDTYTLSKSEPDFFELITSEKEGITEQTILGTQATVVFEYYEPMDSYIIAYKDISERRLTQMRMVSTSAIGTLGLILFVGILLFFLTKRLVQPINRLSSYAEEVSKGTYDIKLNLRQDMTGGSDEIATLTRSFETMVAEINRHFKEQEEARRSLSEKNEELQASRNELIQRFEEINKQKAYIEYLANYDTLTSLPNRSHFIDRLGEALENKQEGAVLLMDLDNFKSMNDTLGHLFGDYLLESIAGILKSMSGNYLTVARMGGDEFGILLTAPNLLNSTLESLSESFRRSFVIEDTEVESTFSIGITLFPEDSVNKDELISYADIALYSAKSSGKNNAKFFNADMEAAVLKRHAIEKVLRIAIEEDGFSVFYQPQVNLATGEITSYEALLRLKSKAYGPGEFIPVAEESGQIIDIGRWVAREVIRQIHLWQSQGLPVKPVSINFSAYQLYDPEYLTILEEALEANGVSSEMLEVEITESIYIDNADKTIQFLKELRGIGVEISIDDFGTGYSSLNYLTYMPFSKLKIDRSLSVKFLNGPGISVIKSIISLAHSLNLTVVAEGIEDSESIGKLRAAGCDIVQGYYYSRPLAVEDVPATFDHRYLVE